MKKKNKKALHRHFIKMSERRIQRNNFIRLLLSCPCYGFNDNGDWIMFLNDGSGLELLVETKEQIAARRAELEQKWINS